mmetsp:Transcript_39663/g.93452  ORF Transcript_39663/g.93452 Transcript_39663/m.93452 type:complete len:364 (+) Transcript_39663:685-1776(+)
MHLEDGGASLDIRWLDLNLTIESARPDEGSVECVNAVCGGDHDNTIVDIEAVHFGQELVHSLLALVISLTEACASLPADGIDLINEDDAWRLLLGLLEDISDTGRANTHKELDELGCRGLDEWDTGLAGQSLGHERLSCSWWAREEHTLRDLRTHLDKSLRCLQEVNDLCQLRLCLINASYILKLHTCLRLNRHFRLALPGHSRHATGTHWAATTQKQQAGNHQEWEGNVTQDSQELIWLLWCLDIDANTSLLQLLNQTWSNTRKIDQEALRSLANFDLSKTSAAVFEDLHPLHRALLEELQEAGVGRPSADCLWGSCCRGLLHLWRVLWRRRRGGQVLGIGRHWRSVQGQGNEHLHGDALQE